MLSTSNISISSSWFVFYFSWSKLSCYYYCPRIRFKSLIPNVGALRSRSPLELFFSLWPVPPALVSLSAIEALDGCFNFYILLFRVSNYPFLLLSFNYKCSDAFSDAYNLFFISTFVSSSFNNYSNSVLRSFSLFSASFISLSPKYSAN
jgi:hypothetical protein